jgi:hypothetical protein
MTPIDRIIQEVTEATDNHANAGKTSRKVFVPDHLWSTRYLKHHRTTSPLATYRSIFSLDLSTFHRAGKVDKEELSREELLEMLFISITFFSFLYRTRNSMKLATNGGFDRNPFISSTQNETVTHEIYTERASLSIKDDSTNRSSQTDPVTESKPQTAAPNKINILQTWQVIFLAFFSL